MVAIRGHFDGKVIVPDEPVDLPRGQQLIVHVQPIDAATPNSEDSALDWIARNAVDSPALPPDGSAQHDHYLYGMPKKP